MNIVSVLRKQLIEPILLTSSGSPLRKYWRVLEKSQFLPEETLREQQWIKLKKLLEFVYDHNYYYHGKFMELDLHPRDILSFSDFKKIPILTKKDIRCAGDQLITKGFVKNHLIEAKTGGSTGKPVTLYFTEDCSERRNACARRHDRWSGWDIGEPKGCVWGNPKLPSTFKENLRGILLDPIIFLDTMAVTKDSVIEFSRQWKHTKPTLLFGHAHSLYVLANLIMQHNVEGIAPKAIISSSMMLLPHERKRIEEVFGKIIFDRYGCEEVSLIASECEEHQGMHLNIDHLYVEFLKEDGSVCNPGEPGKIVVTDLINNAMPLIRYQVEDIGVPSSRRCSCGRGLPLMDGIVGRTADFLVKKDGTKVAGISLIENTLTKIPGIDQMQIIQENIETIRIRIVLGEHFTQSDSDAIVLYFKELFQYPKSIEIEPVDVIPPEKSGKYRFSICRIEEQGNDYSGN